jgi:hypothetical protein
LCSADGEQAKEVEEDENSDGEDDENAEETVERALADMAVAPSRVASGKKRRSHKGRKVYYRPFHSYRTKASLAAC